MVTCNFTYSKAITGLLNLFRDYGTRFFHWCYQMPNASMKAHDNIERVKGSIMVRRKCAVDTLKPLH